METQALLLAPVVVPFVPVQGQRLPTCPICRGPIRAGMEAVQCPGCGGDLEHVRWDNGGEKIACTNWRECKYREKAPPVPADEQP